MSTNSNLNSTNIHRSILRCIELDAPCLLTLALTFADRKKITINFDYFKNNLVDTSITTIVGNTNDIDFELNKTIRLLLLHFIRPSVGGHILNYEPSKWLARTFAKGWSKTSFAQDSLSWSDTSNHTSHLVNIMNSVLEVNTIIFSYLAPTMGSITIIPPLFQMLKLQLVCKSWYYSIAAIFGESILEYKRKLMAEIWGASDGDDSYNCYGYDDYREREMDYDWADYDY